MNMVELVTVVVIVCFVLSTPQAHRRVRIWMVRHEADDTSVYPLPPDDTRLNHAEQCLVAQSHG